MSRWLQKYFFCLLTLMRNRPFAAIFWFFTESWRSKQGLRRSPKSYTRKKHESATNPIARRGQGAIAPCRVKGQRPLWGLGQRPNCSAGDQHRKRTQQRCRQRSVPASNFARPQTRPQAALPPRFRVEPFLFPVSHSQLKSAAPVSRSGIGITLVRRQSWPSK